MDTVDALDIKNKIIYEYNGDYWHGNPTKYEASGISKGGTLFGELYENTLDKKAKFTKAGFKVISIWESEWNQRKKDGNNSRPSCSNSSYLL